MTLHPVSWLVLRAKDIGHEVRHPEAAGVVVKLIFDESYRIFLQWVGRREATYIDPSDLPGSWIYPVTATDGAPLPLLLRRGTPEIVEIMWDALET